jgi:hypothetical protein
MRRTYEARVDREVRALKDYLDPVIESVLADKRRALRIS